jgi:hypothetical protein
LEISRQVLFQLLLLGVSRLLFGQVVQLPGQRFDLLVLLTLHPLEILLQLPQLLLQLLHIIGLLRRHSLGAAPDHKSKHDERRREMVA